MRQLPGEEPAQSRQIHVAWNAPRYADNTSLRWALDNLRAKCDVWAAAWLAASGRDRNQPATLFRRYHGRLLIVWTEYQSRRYTAQKVA